MAALEVMALNEATDELQAPQGADTYVLLKPVHFSEAVTMASTLNGRDLAADAVLLDSALQPADVGTAAAADATDFATAAQGALADTALQPTDVGTAAAADAVDFATAAEGALAATAVQPADLGTAAAEDVGFFATAAQGLLADSALQPGEAVPVGDPALTDARLPIRTHTTGITAFASGGQTNAVLLTTEYNVVNTVAAAGDSVKLPPAAGGLRAVVFNRGANALDLFPNTSDVINALAVDTAISVAAASKITLFASDDTIWYEE
jgi:hypothetical protein